MSRRTLTFRNLSFLMGGLIGTVVLVGGLVLADAYRELVAQTRRVATNLTLTVERDVDHDIRLVDLSLQGIIRATLLPGIDALPPELKQAALFDSAFTQAEFGRFLILDGAGRVVAASGRGRIASTDFSDRAYFLRHRDNPSPDMFVGPALTSRLDGQRVLPVSRRVAAQDGSFGGLVVGTIHPSAFRHVFERLDLGAGGAVTLAHQDGTVLLREPELPAGVAMSPAAAGTPESLPPGPKTAAPPGARAAPPDGGTAPWRNGFGLAVGPDGVLRFYAARRMSGLPLTVVVGFSAWDIMTPWLHKLVVIGSLTLLLCGAAVLLTRALGRELRRRHDAEDRLLAFNRELEARVQREVAARDEARTRLVAGQRMEALGQLAGGIAHDINNVLQVVSSANQALARQCAPASDGRRLSGMIAAAAERGAAVTRRLLVFARQGELRAEPVDVVALVSGLRELLVHTLGGTLAIELRAGPDLAPVLADRVELETVLVNLATNARDAMAETGGTLSIEVRCLEPQAGTGRGRQPPGGGRERHPDGRNQAAPGAAGWVCIAVADTGCGMDPALRARVVEPFFTTKPVGKGTGLGLSMANGFAEQSGGWLEIDSRPGEGTTVTLWLPRDGTAPAVSPAPSSPPRHVAVPGPEQLARVLLVDNDPVVRELLAAELAELGYEVCQAGDAGSALGMMDRPPDVLVTDFSMPGMDGLALIREAHRRHPDLPAILVTGHAGDSASLARSGAFAADCTLLHKPLRTSRLAERIAAALRAPVGVATQDARMGCLELDA